VITHTLRINQLSSGASEWYIGQYLDAMDRLDIDRYAAFLANDVSVQFNNAPAVRGKPAVVGMLAGYWKSFASIEHELVNIYGTDRSFALEARNHYTRLDGRKVTTNAVAFTDRNDEGKVTSVRIYADASPVFQN
jgi:ketosteroid isomerase-like protein